MSSLQTSGLQDCSPAVQAALRDAGHQLGTALRRPGMVAAAASWDHDAVPALCILTLGSASRSSTAAPQKLSGLRSLLQPATIECLRCVATSGGELLELQHYGVNPARH
jgi:hypothetical protein